MFAGIIEKKSIVRAVAARDKMLRVRIAAPRGWKLSLGQSVDVDGICSTVARLVPGAFEVEYMPETLSKTTASLFKKGSIVNLERSLAYGKRIDGHPVQGHVDIAAPLSGAEAKGKSKELTFKLPARVSRRVALHGSIAINGVSLTVARMRGTRITVALIPHTLAHTNLGALRVGQSVNIETDHSAAYLEGLAKK
jgi:riboflavin synthase